MTDVTRRTVVSAAAASGLMLSQNLWASDVAGQGRAASASASAAAAAAQDVRLSSIWTAFCQTLAQAGQVLDRPEAPGTTLDQAEGLRYLTRLSRTALEMTVESSDPDFPRFFQLSNETIKIGADNPDNIYMNAIISGNREYRIWGNKGSVPYLSFGTKANRYAIDGTMLSTGEIEANTMKFGPDGSFEIIVSTTRKGSNWLPLRPDSTMLLVRQTFFDKSTEKPATIHIEAIDRPRHPRLLDAAAMQHALTTATGFVAGTANTFANWTKQFMSRPNELLPWDQAAMQRGGGDPNIYYLHGYWKLKPDEAWVIETTVPNCRFWNFQLDNWWMESLDYRTIDNVWTNKHKAKLGPNNKLMIVVAARDPGIGNWIDTAGHESGTALLRWISADTTPQPQCRIVKLDQLQS